MSVAFGQKDAFQYGRTAWLRNLQLRNPAIFNSVDSINLLFEVSVADNAT